MLRRPAALLFLCLFAAQAGFVGLAPILPEVAREFGVSTAAAGQLRTVSGLAGAVMACAAGALARRLGARDQLLAGVALIGLGSLATAAAPSLTAIAAAQAALGAGVAITVASGTAAVAEWAPAERRSRVLAWALLGQPAAWVAGMPVIGLVSQLGWRWTWIAVPFVASVVALGALVRRPRDPVAPRVRLSGRALLGRPDVIGWATGELLAYTAWAGALVYAGALFVESYGVSSAAAGVILGVVALGYFPGTLLARRGIDAGAEALLVRLGLACALAVGTFCLLRPSWWLSALVLAAAMGAAGGRTIAGSAFGLDADPARRIAVMGIRAAALQLGYLLGAGLGGVTLAASGYGALGALLALLFVLAVLPYATVCRRPAPLPEPA